MRKMSRDRLNRKVFDWARQKVTNHRVCKNWVARVETQLRLAGVNVEPGDDVHKKVCLQKLSFLCEENTREKWLKEINRVGARRGKGLNKLRTYRGFKQEFRTESYVISIGSRARRRALALFRSGVAPIRLETGRYERGKYLPVKERTCYFCDNIVESELHVILECPLYNDLREEMFHHCNSQLPNFNDMERVQQLNFILGAECICQNSTIFLNALLKRRRSFVYTV